MYSYHTHTHIYIYLHHINININISTYTHTHTYIYIYIMILFSLIYHSYYHHILLVVPHLRHQRCRSEVLSLVHKITSEDPAPLGPDPLFSLALELLNKRPSDGDRRARSWQDMARLLLILSRYECNLIK